MNTTKNLITLLLAMLAVNMAVAHDFEVYGIYFNKNGTEATVTFKGESYENEDYSSDLVIPETVTYNDTTYTVTAIGDYAFYGCMSLTGIEFPYSLTSIGNYAFAHCRGLTDVIIGDYIGNHLWYIGNYAFAYCVNLTSATFGRSIEQIGNGAFNGCDKLTKIYIHDLDPWFRIHFNGDPGLKAHVFVDGQEIKNLVIPETEFLTSISQYAFNGWSYLTSVTIPATVTEIGTDAFIKCNSLTRVDISDLRLWNNILFSTKCSNPCSYAHHLFLNGAEIKELVIDESRIGQFAFFGCSSMNSVTIGNNVVHIGNYAFSQCSGLTSVTLGEAVETIGNAAFNMCIKLTNIEIPSAVKQVGDSAFCGCSLMTNAILGESVQQIGRSAFASCRGLTSVVIPDAVTKICSAAFQSCVNLKNLTIGSSVETIGEDAFNQCTKLADITSLATVPPVIGNRNCFWGTVYKNATLYVPVKSLEDYRNADYWENFINIQPISSPIDVPGDVNGDGEVSLADVNAVIDIILNDSAQLSGDVNGDGEVSIADINAIIDIILGGGAPTPSDHEWVDLGLPSGTLWATCNIGATSPEDYGDYFAWGETEPKQTYNWATYKWSSGGSRDITKYCTDSILGTIDGKTELEPEDDAAYVNWGPEWRIPSKEQLSELFTQCDWEWTTMNGVNGKLVTGPNGNSLFFPAAGYRLNSSLSKVGSYGDYWLHTLDADYSGNAFYLDFNWERAFCDYNYFRCYGLSVRAVRVQ